MAKKNLHLLAMLDIGNARYWKIKFQQRGIKPKSSIDKGLYLFNSLPLSPTKSYYSNVFFTLCNNFSEQNCLHKPAADNVSRFNHSFQVNDTVANKTEHFPQLFTLGPQIAFKEKKKWHNLLSRSTITNTNKLDISVYKYRDNMSVWSQ